MRLPVTLLLQKLEQLSLTFGACWYPASSFEARPLIQLAGGSFSLHAMAVGKLPAPAFTSTITYFFMASLTCSVASLVALLEAETAALTFFSATSSACSAAFLLA